MSDGESSNEGGLNDQEVADLSATMMRYFLMQSISKLPIKKVDIVTHCLRGNKRQFQQIFEKSTEQLKDVRMKNIYIFGIYIFTLFSLVDTDLWNGYTPSGRIENWPPIHMRLNRGQCINDWSECSSIQDTSGPLPCLGLYFYEGRNFIRT